MNANLERVFPPMLEIDFDMIRQFELPCRCCGKPVHMYWQKSFREDGSGIVQVDCRNPDCTPREGGLYMVTREIRNWLSDRVAQEWRIKELPGWKAPDGLQTVLSYIERRDCR